MTGRRTGLGALVALLAALFLAVSPVRASEGAKPPAKKPPRGDVCAETPPFVAMDMLAVPIIRDGDVIGIMNLKPCFAAKPEQADTVAQALPILQDLYVRRLHLYASTRLDPSRPLDVRALRQLLQRAADSVLPQNVPVLLTFLAMRQIG